MTKRVLTAPGPGGHGPVLVSPVLASLVCRAAWFGLAVTGGGPCR
jgi:hypothetical protein